MSALGGLGWTEEALGDLERLRGWTEEAIDRFGLTWDAATGRIGIPVRDSVGGERGELHYDPTGHRQPKMVASAGSSRELFPPPEMIGELETCAVGDLDEHRGAIRVRWTFEKNDRYRHLELPDDLFAALLATVPPREDRDLAAPLFPGLTDARLRMAITRACRATGTPHFSPHGLRRRRGSLHYKRTGSLAEVAELLGDSKRVAADHYVYALTDYREVDKQLALARARA